jgi:hypothetical protein
VFAAVFLVGCPVEKQVQSPEADDRVTQTDGNTGEDLGAPPDAAGVTDALDGGDPTDGPGVVDAGSIPDGCCQPGCDGKKCGDGDGCGGVCTGHCESGLHCLVEGGLSCATDETIPFECDGRECGQTGHQWEKCNGPCPEGMSCRYGWATPECVECPTDGLGEDEPCDLSKIDCSCGLDCVAPDGLNNPVFGNCLKNCSRDRQCGPGRGCIKWPAGLAPSNLYDCYKVTEAASGAFENCLPTAWNGPGTAPGFVPDGTSDLSVSIEGTVLSFTECAGVFRYTDDYGNVRGPVIVLRDSSKKESGGVVYDYLVLFEHGFFRSGQYPIGDVLVDNHNAVIGTAILKIDVAPDGLPVSSELIGFGYAGAATIDMPYVGCDEPFSGALSAVKHRLFKFVCQSPNGEDCLKRIAR